jgi:hypothetical protein
VSNKSEMAPRLRKVLIVIGLSCTLAIGVATAALRIRQNVIRVRAQHVLDTFQHVAIGAPVACDLAPERNEWGFRVSSEGACNDATFHIEFHGQHPPYVWPRCYERQFNRLTRSVVHAICRTYEALAGRPTFFLATADATGGVVTQKAATVFVLVPDDAADEDLPATLWACATVGHGLNRRRPDADGDQQTLHPTYRVFMNQSRANADYNPGGRIFFIEVGIGTAADRSDSERLSQFDLSCLARMHPCSLQDLMPAAYQQYEIDVRQPKAPPQ